MTLNDCRRAGALLCLIASSVNASPPSFRTEPTPPAPAGVQYVPAAVFVASTRVDDARREQRATAASEARVLAAVEGLAAYRAALARRHHASSPLALLRAASARLQVETEMLRRQRMAEAARAPGERERLAADARRRGDAHLRTTISTLRRRARLAAKHAARRGAAWAAIDRGAHRRAVKSRRAWQVAQRRVAQLSKSHERGRARDASRVRTRTKRALTAIQRFENQGLARLAASLARIERALARSPRGASFAVD